MSTSEESKKEPEKIQPKAEPGELEPMLLRSFLMRRNQGPKINDTIEFPDLGTPSEAYEELKGFQPVKSSGLNKANTPGQNNESISTVNKYTALSSNSN